eukprot:3502783-Heterocapsa_arctica.AAC.1
MPMPATTARRPRAIFVASMPSYPGGAGEAVLEEHADDRHCGQAAVCDLRGELAQRYNPA